MNILTFLLKILDTKLPSTPEPYGAFHIVSCALSIALAVILCVSFRKHKDQNKVRRTVFVISLIVLISEILKQINFSATFPETGGVLWDFQWYAFPFQFCSIPMYVGILQGFIKKGKLHNALCAFLASYAIFAGVCVMIYPISVFTPTLFICIQTMLCHGTMLPVGAYLIYSGHIRMKARAFLGAMAVFGVALSSAVLLNELTYYSGILCGETFNMFFVSRHFECTLPVYSAVHLAVPYPLNLIIYFLGFSAAAYLVFLAGSGIKRLADKAKKQTA